MRKSSKLAKLIIALLVTVSALWIVTLYPKMEESALKRKEYYDELDQEHKAEYGEWILTPDFMHYAVEAAYQLYAESVQLDCSIFEYYGWNNDLERFENNASYTATYYPADTKEQTITNIYEPKDYLVKTVLEFDENGKLTTALGVVQNDKIYMEEPDYIRQANESLAQFAGNYKCYAEMYELKHSMADYTPKNFKLEIGLSGMEEWEYNSFLQSHDEWFGTHYYSTRQLYFETGAYWIILAVLVLIILVAFTLPFIKKLNTGNEKLFSMSFEVMILVTGATVGAIYSMCILMSMTTMRNMIDVVETNQNVFQLLGEPLSAHTVYNVARVGNFVGWSVALFLVYAVAANIRQFFAHTKYYLKYQVLSVRILRWMKNKILNIYRNVTEINLGKNLNKTVLKIVIANFVVLSVICCFWLFGIIGLVIYSLALFVVLKRKLKKIKNQYDSILQATNKMAEGDLKISLEEDLGVFQEIGDSLEKVQQGFEKAVKEESKSQSMKTELITNVSHDLKTPLTAIITYVDLLKKENITDEERKSYIQTLDQKSQRLKVLIEDLFEVSKAHSGNVTMNFMDVDVVSLLKQVKSEMSDQIAESNLDFRWNFATEKVILSLDGQRTYRVFENLINNILKYAMPHSRVYVNVMQNESEVKIMFRNVSAQELDFDSERLTDRFVRGDASRNSEGSGLGLAIAKSFVELQKGTFKIDVDGDLFKVTITWIK